MTEPSPYTPVGCGFYDMLEAAAVRKVVTHVRYLEEDGRETRYAGLILDVYSRGQEEFVVIEGGREIRLDRLAEIDGVVNTACRRSGVPPPPPGNPR